MLLVWSWAALLGPRGALEVRLGSGRPFKAVLGSRLSRGLVESRRLPKARREASRGLIERGPFKSGRTIKALLGLVEPGAVSSRTIRPDDKNKYKELKNHTGIIQTRETMTRIFTKYYIVIIIMHGSPLSSGAVVSRTYLSFSHRGRNTASNSIRL